MIEIKITIEAAISILVEKMKIELKQRQRSRLIPAGLRLEDLNYTQLINIVDTSIFDTLFLLPIDLVLQDINISYVFSEAVKSLARVFKKEEFALFNRKRAKKIVNKVTKILSEAIKSNNFINN